MTIDAISRPAGALEQVLVVAPDATAAPLSFEIMRRGASVCAASDIGGAADALRRSRFDTVIVAARDDADATALLIALIRAGTRARANIILLVDLDKAARYGAAIFAADEIIAASLSPRRITDATGVGQRG